MGEPLVIPEHEHTNMVGLVEVSLEGFSEADLTSKRYKNKAEYNYEFNLIFEFRINGSKYTQHMPFFFSIKRDPAGMVVTDDRTAKTGNYGFFQFFDFVKNLGVKVNFNAQGQMADANYDPITLPVFLEGLNSQIIKMAEKSFYAYGYKRPGSKYTNFLNIVSSVKEDVLNEWTNQEAYLMSPKGKAGANQATTVVAGAETEERF